MFKFSFKVNEDRQKEQIHENTKVISEAIAAYQKAMEDSAHQYNEHRKKAEEQIDRGARLTKHRINL